MKTLLTASIFLLFSSFFATSANSYNNLGSWTLELNKDNIQIYTRDVPGMEIKEFKAYAELNAKPAEIEKIMRNISDYSDWMSDVKSAKILKNINADERIEYMRVAAPWPFDDRDIVNHFKIERNTSGANSFKVVISNKHDYISEKEGVVRIKKSSGFWEFTPLASGKTKVTYQFLGDPGGEVPDWAANMFIVDGPFATLSNLKDLAE